MTEVEQQWMVYHDRQYAARSWPYELSWEEWIKNPTPLIGATSDLCCVSPTDGAQEMPLVPVNLPRVLPRGKYSLAIHHDADWIDVLLESHDSPVITPWTKSAAILCAVQLLSANGLWIHTFSSQRRTDDQPCEQAKARTTPVTYTSRRTSVPERTFDWKFYSCLCNGVEYAMWRIRRRDIADVIDGSTMRLSISRTNLETIEGVAWGAYHIWDARPDEFGIVRLATDVPGDGPRLRRVDLIYNPAKEQGRLRMYWERLHDAHEKSLGFHPPNWEASMQSAAVHINDAMHMVPMNSTCESTLWNLADGHTRVAISAFGAPATRFFIEKRSGNHIAPSPLPNLPTISDQQLLKSALAACEAKVDEHERRKHSEEKTVYRVHRSYHATAVAQACLLLKSDDRFLAMVRDEADFMLSLQRPDGTFAGYHLQTTFNRAPQPWAGGGYDSGPAGELWVAAYELLGDEKYIAASRKLVEAFAAYRVEFNHNFSAIGLYHLAAHYRVTHEPLALEHALHHAQHCAAVLFLPLGYQGGHNYYTVYGCLTLRGMAHLAAVLPADHAYRAQLVELCIRMSNQLISRLQPNGLIDARDRYHLGQCLRGNSFFWSLLAVAPLLPDDDAARIESVFQGMISRASDVLPWCDSDLIRYVAKR